MSRKNKSHYHDCGRKVRYATEHEALKQIRKIHDRGRMEPMDVYYCYQCSGWHITKKMEFNKF